MGDDELRAATIEFVAELCEPVGPWTFVGQGGRIALERHRIHQAAGTDPLGGVFAAEARVQEIMRAWADAAPVPAIFAVLFELAARPHETAGGDPSRWRDAVTELLLRCAGRDRAGFVAALAMHRDSPGLVDVLAELEAWVADA